MVLSFLATALTSFAAILYGYFAEILPGVELTPADDAYIVWARSNWRRPRKKRTLEDQQRKEKAMERFLLALSDLQLVTGIALLVTSLIECQASLYTQLVVSASAWFSCTTHLATLSFLDRYLQQHPRLRIFRIVCMMVIGIGALISQGMTLGYLTSSALYSVSFSCILQHHANQDDKIVEGTFVLTNLALWLSLIRGYAQRVTLLFFREWTTRITTANSFLSCLLARALRVPGSQSKRSALLSRMKDQDISRIDLFLLARSESKCAAWYTIAETFLLGSFGVCQLILLWSGWSGSVKNLLSDSNSWGFGQIIPLLLLILPILTVCETIAGEYPNYYLFAIQAR